MIRVSEYSARSMIKSIESLFNSRFIKFCVVGASGVFVNLGLLAILADWLDLHVNLASALAIEASINSNFIINELWTFRDRRGDGVSPLLRWLRFHLVSLVGALMQWCVFILINMAWVSLLALDLETPSDTNAAGLGFIESHFWRPIISPPDVGYLKYLSQLCGIGVATLWNYFVNFYWTWGNRNSKMSHG